MQVSEKKAIVKVTWVPPTEGGRGLPPTGPRYSTVARFQNQEEWSLVLEWHGQDIVAWLLSDKAPEHLLNPGSKFDLQEGNRTVAHGEVLDTRCPNCGLIEGHANRCFADVLISELVILRRCQAALQEMEAAYKSDRGITLSEAIELMKKGLRGERKVIPQ